MCGDPGGLWGSGPGQSPAAARPGLPLPRGGPCRPRPCGTPGGGRGMRTPRQPPPAPPAVGCQWLATGWGTHGGRCPGGGCRANRGEPRPRHWGLLLRPGQGSALPWGAAGGHGGSRGVGGRWGRGGKNQPHAGVLSRPPTPRHGCSRPQCPLFCPAGGVGGRHRGLRCSRGTPRPCAPRACAQGGGQTPAPGQPTGDVLNVARLPLYPGTVPVTQDCPCTLGLSP